MKRKNTVRVDNQLAGLTHFPYVVPKGNIRATFVFNLCQGYVSTSKFQFISLSRLCLSFIST